MKSERNSEEYDFSFLLLEVTMSEYVIGNIALSDELAIELAEYQDDFIPVKYLPSLIKEFIRIQENDNFYAEASVDSSYFHEELIDVLPLIVEESRFRTIGENDINNSIADRLNTLSELISMLNTAETQIKAIRVEAKEIVGELACKVVITEDMQGTATTLQDIRYCEIAGCTNQLPSDSHHAMKYCTSCRLTGKVKKMYNNHSQGKY